jgi:hypothetical protein
MFQWPLIQPLNLPGKAGAIIDRQMAEITEFRKLVDAGKAVGKFFVRDEGINEALRRELVIRTEAITYALARKQDPQPFIAAAAAVRALLDERDGHRR